MNPNGDVTRILQEVRSGREGSMEHLLSRLYDELESLASKHLAKERVDHTLDPSALLHEAFLRLIQERGRDWESRVHFLSVASLAMRRVLVNHARDRRAVKRGRGAERLTLTSVAASARSEDTPASDAHLDVLDLEEALDLLEAKDPDKARLVQLRFYGGLNHQEIAALLETSVRTVERGWRLARAFLHKTMGEKRTEREGL